jgi:dipeptidyl aminopeptidase/acylaminoacyl peptidase
MQTVRPTRIPRLSYIALALLCAISSVGLPSFSANAAAVLEADQAASKIAFDRGGNIYTMNADGSNQTLVGNSLVLAVDPSVSPDGTRFAFTCGSEPHNICVMNADGSNVKTLTDVMADRSPAWSPDGTRIAFHSTREGSSHIYFISPDGGAVTRLTVNDENLLGEHSPAWSPDGTRVAFIGETETATDIYIATLDGTVTRVTNSDTLKSSPAWSRDGTQIAFDTVDTICVVNVGGGAVSVIASAGDLNQSPAWSSDGTRIAFKRVTIFRDENDSIVNREESIHVMNADGSGVMSLNSPGANPVFQPVQEAPPPPPVKTPAERIADLDALVRSFNLHHGTTNSLTVKLRDALNALDAGNTAVACVKLADFANHTRALSGRKLTTAQAAQLIDEANSIRAALGCS